MSTSVRAPSSVPGGEQSGGKSKTITMSKTAKMTGAIKLDLDEHDPSYAGRLLVFDTDRNELGRLDLPKQYRSGAKEPFVAQNFKDYLSERLGITVFDVFYKLRDHKKGRLAVRYAKLGESDKEPKWPFVPGMRIYVQHCDEGRTPAILMKGASGTNWSQASTTDTEISSKSGCSIM